MDSKHDILTAAMTVIFVVAFVILDATHNMTTSVETILGGGITATIAYWFTRGGASIVANGNSNATDVEAVATKAATQAIAALVNTPATGGGNNEVQNSGNVQN